MKDGLATIEFYIPVSFQFLGIPPKGEPLWPASSSLWGQVQFPISRDPPEGGTCYRIGRGACWHGVSNF